MVVSRGAEVNGKRGTAEQSRTGLTRTANSSKHQFRNMSYNSKPKSKEYRGLRTTRLHLPCRCARCPSALPKPGLIGAHARCTEIYRQASTRSLLGGLSLQLCYPVYKWPQCPPRPSLTRIPKSDSSRATKKMECSRTPLRYS